MLAFSEIDQHAVPERGKGRIVSFAAAMAD
jgi:hypothetical protein